MTTEYLHLGEAKSLTEFLETAKKDSKLFHSFHGCGTIELAKVDLDNLRLRFQKHLQQAFGHWNDLHDMCFCDTDDNTIEVGCQAMAVVMTHQVLRLMHHKALRHLGYQKTNEIYGNDLVSSISYGVEMPDGCAHLVEQFGISCPIETPRNYRVLHIWDGSNRETLGIDPKTVQMSPPYMSAGLEARLRRAGVKMREIDLQCPDRTVWDSFLIKKYGGHSTGALDFTTTYPSQHYDLPRDVFIAYALCSGDDGKTIEDYAQRLLIHPGADDNTKTGILTVARCVTDQDMYHFLRVLFRHGGPTK